jgi:hypothetical protein
MIDVDDNEYVDYDMGFGALFAGHMNPVVRRAVAEQLEHGSLYVTPCELDAEVCELLGARYGLPMWRPTNSGTEATHDAIKKAFREHLIGNARQLDSIDELLATSDVVTLHVPELPTTRNLIGAREIGLMKALGAAHKTDHRAVRLVREIAACPVEPMHGCE